MFGEDLRGAGPLTIGIPAGAQQDDHLVVYLPAYVVVPGGGHSENSDGVESNKH